MCLQAFGVQAQGYLYQGKVTFERLSGKDCGGFGVGDNLPIEILIDAGQSGFTGFSRLEGSDPGRLDGRGSERMSLVYPDVTSAGGNTLSLMQIGKPHLTGVLHERELAAGEAGCDISRGRVEADRVADEAQVAARREVLGRDFQWAQAEHAARHREPERYAEIMRLMPLASQAAGEGGDLHQALSLYDGLQGEMDHVYGERSLQSFQNQAARAQLHVRLGEYGQAESMWSGLLEHAKRDFPAQVASAAYNLGDVLERQGRREEALSAFVLARETDEAQHGPEHREVAADLVREADVLEALGRGAEAVHRYERAALIQQQVGTDDKQAGSVLWRLASLLHKLGRDEEALRWYEAERGATERRSGHDDPEVAVSLEAQAFALDALGRYPEAIPLLERSLAIREARLGDGHALTAKSKCDLGWARFKMGEQQAAWALCRQASESYGRATDGNPRDEANLYTNLALIALGMGHFEDALAAQKRALGIYQSLGKDSPDVATALLNLADMHRDRGDYAEALPFYRRALAMFERESGAEHPDTATALGNLALYHKMSGDYEAAESMYRRALEIDRRALGPDHPATATDLQNLASLYAVLGRYEQAEAMHLEALGIRERVFGPDHVETRLSLNGLSVLHEMQGQYDKALPYGLRALEIAEHRLGTGHTETAASLNNLSVLYDELGQMETAIGYSKRALGIYESTLGKSHTLTAAALGNLSVLYEQQGRYDEALPLARRALDIRMQALGEAHADTAANLTNLAVLHQRLGQADKALALYKRSLSIHERRLGAGHAETATVLNNMASAYDDLGAHDKAIAFYERALHIREKALGETHKLTASTWLNKAFAEGSAARSTTALASFEHGNRIGRQVMERVFAIANERDKLAYVQRQEWGYFGELSLIQQRFAHDRSVLRQGLDTVLSRKGVVFDAQARQQEAIARSLDPETRKSWDELAAQRSGLARLMQVGPDGQKAEEYQSRIKSLQDAIARLEGQLAAKSALVAEEVRQRNISTEAVAKRLPKGAVLAEFVKIEDYDWERGRWAGTQRYLAFTLRGDGQVDLVDLGNADTLETSVQAQLKQLDRIGLDTGLQLAAARNLNDLLWTPLAKVVAQADTVIFSPDGLLNLVPFGAMLDEQGRFFIERHTVAYVTSGRDLTKASIGKPDSRLFLAANPAFDFVPEDAVPTTQVGATRSAGFSLRFGALPGTQEEAESIPGMFSGRRRVVIGRAATERAVLGAGHPQIIHLATHGFFLGDQPSLVKGTRGAMALQDGPANKPVAQLPPGYENPLVRSGLALAGANHAAQTTGAEDGLLTALEVSGMDLHGTDLVTLSACETGRGDVRSGEGVFGLRRAFSLSGAKHLVMSLWPVGDEVTAQQMKVMYREYGTGKRPVEALRTAQLETLAQLRLQGKDTPPALWAPFIVQGW